MRTHSVGFTLNKLSEDVLEDTTILEVSDFNVGVESNLDLEWLASVRANGEDFVNLKVATSKVNVEGFSTIQTQRVSVLSIHEFSGEDTHTDQVRSVDSLVALSNDGLDTLEVRSPEEK